MIFSILKSRDITLPTKVHLVKAMVFPVVIYGCESWAIKKAECMPKNWCFWTVVLEKSLESSLDSKESNQSILKEINPEYPLEGLKLKLKLKLQYFGYLMPRVDSMEKTLMLGKIGGERREGWQRMRWLDGITDSMTWVWVSFMCWWWTGKPGMLQSIGHKESDMTEQLNWTDSDL